MILNVEKEDTALLNTHFYKILYVCVFVCVYVLIPKIFRKNTQEGPYTYVNEVKV